MLGLRASGFINDAIVQFTVSPISFNRDYDSGIYSSLWLGRSYQIKNWEVYFSGGLEYRSKEILDYYYSTSELMEQLGFRPYKAGAGTDVIGQVGASYPISEDVLFETYFRYTNVSDSISDSSIMQFAKYIPDRDPDITEFGLLLSYVF